MASWHDPDRWTALLDGSACPFCTGGPRNIIATLPAAYVTVDEQVHVHGYCCLVLRRHAIELHELSADEAAALMHDIQHVARALQDVTGAIKINYEIHGNIVPHVHVHLVARHPGDNIERSGRPFNQQGESPWRKGEFAVFAEALAAAISGELPAN